MQAQGKAELFADTFSGKFILPANVTNLYSELQRETLELGRLAEGGAEDSQRLTGRQRYRS